MFLATTQLTFTCSKAIIERLEKGVKFVQSELLTYLTPCSSISIIYFEQVNVCWEGVSYLNELM